MGSPDPSKTRNFTWRELSTQNKLENAHVAHSGKVYDVSSFVSAHPGGIDQIMFGAGHDITHLFNSYHKPQTIKTLEKYYVGDLVDNEMPVYAIDKPQFYRVVKKRVMDKFKSLHIDSKSDYKMFSVYIFFFVLWWALWYGSIKWHESWLIVIPCSLALGWCSSLVLFLIGHDLSHFAVTHNPWVWRVGNFIVSVMSGLSIYCWTYQHTYGHHNYTNVDGVDPDTRTNDIDVWRIKDRQTWIRRYRLQCIYMPILYCFLAIKMKLQDFPTMISLQKSTIRMNPPRFYQYVEFFVAKLLHFILLLFIPMMIMPPTSLTVYYMAYEMIYGFILALVTVLSHVSTDLTEIQPEDTKDKNWAEQQVLSTKDYATDSWIWTLLTGANNHQVAHHLFPDVLQCHYPLITPIVRETCAEFGINYHCEANIVKTSLEHMKYLFKMGQDPSHEKTQ